MHLATFWAKRIRRLLPAMALMVATTMAAALVLAPPLAWKSFVRDAGASMLYLSNIVFARIDTDYFADSSGDSPFLHTWSLGVEEQFYLLWPILFLGVWWAVRRRPELRRPALTVLFAVGAVVSLAIAIWWTSARPKWGFFLLPSRAWEFAAAGLLAMWRLPDRLRTRAIATTVAVLGLVLIVGAGAAFSGELAYPGMWASIPVAGTLLVILAGTLTTANPVSAVLALAPFQWLGRVSYSWYLWHWPAIVLAVAWTGSNTPTVRSIAAFATLPVAALAYSRFENPVRHSRWLTASNGRTYVVALATIAAVAVGLGGFHLHASSVMDTASQRELVAVRAHYTSYRSDIPCTSEIAVGQSTVCDLGDPDGDTVFMLIGDSHALHWAEAFGETASDRGDSMVLYWASACPAADVELAAGEQANELNCDNRNADLQAALDLVDPDVVVMSSTTRYSVSGMRSGDLGGAEAWEEELEGRVGMLEERGIEVGLIEDNPSLPFNPLHCQSLHGLYSGRCEIAVTDLSDDQALLDGVQRRAAERHGMAVFSVNEVICPGGTCTPAIGGIPAYTDESHLSYVFTRTQDDRIARFLDELLS